MSTRTLTAAIGNTPLVELTRMSPRPGVRLFAKLEGHNPSGSIKDRVASALVSCLEKHRGLRPGDTLIEASTGNTAIALAMLARQRGYHLKVVVPHGVVPSIEDILDLFGVEIIWCEPHAGMRGAIERTRELAAKHGWHAVGQFDNPVNLRTHYETTGAEIAAQLPQVDALVAGIGTGGTLMGVGRRLRETNPHLKIVGVEPKMGEKLQGLRSLDDAYCPPLLKLDELNGRFLVSSATALQTAREVVQTEGVLAGVSAGAALHAARRIAERMERGNIVVMFSDGAWKYLPARPWEAAQANSECLDETHWW
ncbi:MAG: cysteine synthase [Myxococcota bacterium]|jgi:cysteine synthase